MSLISSSSRVGSFLDEILITRQRQMDADVVSDLRQLHICLNQLCLQYETRLFIHISGSIDLGRSLSSVTDQLQATQQGLPRGRPRKIINLAMVWYISYS